MLQLDLTLILLVALAVGYFLPRLSAYFLGPVLLGVAAMVFVWSASGDSGASMGLVLVFAAAFLAGYGGILLITTGLVRMWWQRRAMQPPSMADRPQGSPVDGSWRLFTTALAIAPWVGILIPLDSVTGRVGDDITRIISVPGWVLLSFLWTALLLPCVLFMGLRRSGMRQFASSGRGTALILVGTAVCWLNELSYIGGISVSAVRPVYGLLLTIGDFSYSLRWPALVAILIGLFLRLHHGVIQSLSPAERALISSGRGLWCLFTGALGIAALIAPLVPIDGMMHMLGHGVVGMPTWALLRFFGACLLPICILFVALRLGGIWQFASSSRGVSFLLVGTALIWLSYLVDIFVFEFPLPPAHGLRVLTHLALVLTWPARAAICIGLFLRWQAHSNTPQAGRVVPNA